MPFFIIDFITLRGSIPNLDYMSPCDYEQQLLAILTGAFVSQYGTDGSYGWTNTYINSYSVVAYSVAIGTLGNLFIGGQFNRDVDVDPGAGEGSYNGGPDSCLYDASQELWWLDEDSECCWSRHAT